MIQSHKHSSHWLAPEQEIQLENGNPYRSHQEEAGHKSRHLKGSPARVDGTTSSHPPSGYHLGSRHPSECTTITFWLGTHVSQAVTLRRLLRIQSSQYAAYMYGNKGVFPTISKSPSRMATSPVFFQAPMPWQKYVRGSRVETCTACRVLPCTYTAAAPSFLRDLQQYHSRLTQPGQDKGWDQG